MAPLAPTRFQFTLRRLLGCIMAASAVLALTAQIGIAAGLLLPMFVGSISAIAIALRTQSRMRLVLLQGGIAALVLTLILGAAGLPEARWSGHRTVTLRFLVSDESSGTPIGGASVQLLDWIDIPNPQTMAAARTLDDGIAEVTFSFPSGGASGLFRDTAFVFFGEHGIRVAAREYSTVQTPLVAFVGKWREFDDLPPPLVKIQLRRLTADPDC